MAGKCVYVMLALAFLEFGVFGMVDECSVNTYNTSESYMQFTKEATVAEFAIVGKFKGLHCCAKGYRSVEWMKDGKMYPWPSSISGLILYPESTNQTIYTQSVTEDDAGNYTCLLKNDTVVYQHNIELRVFDKAPDRPKITYVSSDKEVSIGHPLRLFCEAFVGVVDLPDAHSEAIWRTIYNDSIDDEPRIRQEKVSREDGQVFGTYLIIEEVVAEDFGQYICRISKPGRSIDLPVYIREKVHVEYLNPNPVPWRKMLLWSAVFAVILITLAVLNLRFGLPLRVRFKDRFGAVEENDGKSNDVLIAYAWQDSELVLGNFLPTLESTYNYKCASRELPSNVNMWCSSLSDVSKHSRRLLTILSPSALQNNWDTNNLYQALKQLNTVDAHLTCVALQELPRNEAELKNAVGETLASILKTVPVIRWERDAEEQFWLSLRLRMPSKRLTEQCETIDMTQKPKRLSADSQDSLDGLV